MTPESVSEPVLVLVSEPLPAAPRFESVTGSYRMATFSVRMNARGAPICTNGTVVFPSWPPKLPT